ncbi:MerR family transcriptional regulator [Micromonospora zamorensis]|uniref:MerR family transcriptional regulator n=1 Tax=Micromonospora zamorensis TaxID=709883 RepID=UPI003712DD01
MNVPESMTPWLRGQTDEAVLEQVSQELTVGDVASLVGVSVRTLHHWDAVGLVQPRGRTPGGYRAYSAVDVGRIHRVLVYQELGFALTKIAALLDDPAVDETEQLQQQRRLLEERRRCGAVWRSGTRQQSKPACTTSPVLSPGKPWR